MFHTNSLSVRPRIQIQPRPKRATESAATGERFILVGVGFSTPSRRALRRAEEIARATGCKLRLVHAVPDSSPAALQAPPLVTPEGEPRDWTDRMQSTVQAWAAYLAGVMVPTQQIQVTRGDPLHVLLQEAARPDVDLVLLGRSERPAGAALPHKLLRQCPCPVLVVGERGARPVLVAATDCSDDRLPVLWEASARVPELGERVIAVHNLDAEASRRAAELGQPLSPKTAALLCGGVQEWLDASEHAHTLLMTHHAQTAAGIVSVARSQQADLLVVGVKHESAVSKRTAEVLLELCSLSILFVPMGREREPQPGPPIGCPIQKEGAVPTWRAPLPGVAHPVPDHHAAAPGRVV